MEYNYVWSIAVKLKSRANVESVLTVRNLVELNAFPLNITRGITLRS